MMQDSRSRDSFVLRAALFYAVSYSLLGIHLPFFPVWLQSTGFSAGEVGAILAATALLRIVSVPVATAAADRKFGLRPTIILFATATAAGFSALGLVSGAWLIVALTAFTAFAHTPAVALQDAYTLRGLRARSAVYGPVRLWGSIFFILANLGAGLAFDLIETRHLIWLLAAAAMATALVATLLLPLPAPVPVTEQGLPPRPFWRAGRFIAIVIAASLIQSSHAVYYGFSTITWKAAGFDGLVIGSLWALGVVAEIVLFACVGRLPRAFGPVQLIVLGGLGAAIRWIGLAFDPTGWTLPLLQVLHALSFGASHLGAVAFIAHAAPEGRGATAQGYFSVAQGIAFSASMLLAGTLYAAIGAASYAAMAAIALAGAAVAGVVWLRKPDV
ncbi:MFS transporter [Pseudorhodoplanes sp.]|uniref:MFS transporter n=1 Tax=Pseudorhodoplanes sp. TaxID=1934341 RepID=UPI00391C0809